MVPGDEGGGVVLAGEPKLAEEFIEGDFGGIDGDFGGVDGDFGAVAGEEELII